MHPPPIPTRSLQDFDDEPTVEIPRETMHQLVFGEGHAPAGPDRPTRDLRPLEDVSDGVPVEVGFEDTLPVAAA